MTLTGGTLAQRAEGMGCVGFMWRTSSSADFMKVMPVIPNQTTKAMAVLRFQFGGSQYQLPVGDHTFG